MPKPKRFLEVLPVELLRDAGSGDSPLHCDISLGGRHAQSCEFGGSSASLRRTASGKLWPGSVLIELAGDLAGSDGSGRDCLTVGVRFDRDGETLGAPPSLCLTQRIKRTTGDGWTRRSPQLGEGAQKICCSSRRGSTRSCTWKKRYTKQKRTS